MTAARPVLPRQQATILELIRNNVALVGYPPSIREIAEDIGGASTSTVAYHLRALEWKGYIRRDPGRPRAIQVIEG